MRTFKLALDTTVVHDIAAIDTRYPEQPASGRRVSPSLVLWLVLNQIRSGRDKVGGAYVWRLGQ